MKSVRFYHHLIEKSSWSNGVVQILENQSWRVSFRYALALILLVSSLLAANTSQAQPKEKTESEEELKLDESPTTEVKPKTESASPTSINPEFKKKFKEAQSLFTNKKFLEVKNLLVPLLDKLDQQRLSILTQAQYELKEYTEALRIAQMMISKNEKDETAHTLFGRIQLKLKKEKEALEAFKKALEINHKYQPAYDGLIELYEKRKNYYELALLYNEMITQLGEKNIFLNRLCEIYTKDELYDQAQRYCKKATLKDPNFPDNHVNIGIIYRNQRDNDQAESILKKAADQYAQSVFAQLTYASFLENKKDYINSYKYYSQCLKNESMNEPCLLGHAASAAQILKYEESLESFKKACTLNRKNAVQVRKVLQSLRVEKKMQWIPKYESMVEKCLSI